MEKLKSIASSLGNASSSTGSKLSKAFRFDGTKNMLGGGGPGVKEFSSRPAVGERSLPKSHMILHIVSLFFTFLGICTIGAVASFQAQWMGVSGGVGFTLFLLLLAFFLQFALVIIPTVYDRWEKMKRPAQFLHETRARLILHAFGSLLLFMVAMIVTISAWSAPGCKNVDDDPHASLGNQFKEGLAQWCTTKKASGIFGWLALACWLALLTLTAIVFRKERRQTPGFMPPNSNEQYDHTDFQEPDPYAEPKHEVYDTPQRSTNGSRHDRGVRFASASPVHDVERPMAYSSPSYGSSGFQPMSSYASAQQGPSRTMQLATSPYSDPYEHIRASLVAEPEIRGHHGYGQNAQPYSSGGAPPPSYGGYR